MKEKLLTFGVIIAAIMVTGAILDEAGKGKLGALGQSLAKKVTNGYGV